MTIMTKVVFLLAATGLMAGALAPAASANSVQPEIGVHHRGSNKDCFARNLGKVTNICSTEQWFEVPLVGSPAGWATTIVTAEGAEPKNFVGCLNLTVDIMGNITWVGQFIHLQTFGAPALLTSQGFVPSGGAHMVICRMAEGGTIHLVNW